MVVRRGSTVVYYWGAYSKGGAYWKEGAKSNHYGNHGFGLGLGLGLGPS